MKESIQTSGMERYTQVSNRAVRDDSLGAIALGIYTYIRSHSSVGYKIYKTNVENRFKDVGRVLFNRAWKELVDKGWVISERKKSEDGKFFKWEHFVVVEHEGYFLNEKGKSVPVTDMQDSESQDSESQYSSSISISKEKKTKEKNTPIVPKGDKEREELFWLIAALWNKGFKNFTQIRDYNNTRKKNLKRIVKNYPNFKDIEKWKDLFKRMKKSEWIMSRDGRNNGFKMNIDWVMKDEYFTKIVEGNYN